MIMFLEVHNSSNAKQGAVHTSKIKIYVKDQLQDHWRKCYWVWGEFKHNA